MIWDEAGFNYGRRTLLPMLLCLINVKLGH